MPLDVSFSCWFFYLFMKAQAVIGYYLGYGDTPDFPYVSEQGIGAWYAFGVFLLYSLRHYLRGVVRWALGIGRELPAPDTGEPMSYRVAFRGLIAGLLVFGGFWWAAGMSLFWVIVVMGTYVLLAICITRVRAEAGGQHTVWDLEPMRLFRLFDSRALGPANLATAAMSHWYWRLNRSHPMPSQLEAFKLAQEHGLNLRKLVAPMLAAFALASVVGMWACLHVFYGAGATAKCQGFAVWTGVESYDWLGNAVTLVADRRDRRHAHLPDLPLALLHRLKIVGGVAAQVVNGAVHEHGAGRQVALLEKGLCAFWEGDPGRGAPPPAAVDHGDHGARAVGAVGHSSMPEAQVAHQNTSGLHARLDRWNSRPTRL